MLESYDSNRDSVLYCWRKNDKNKKRITIMGKGCWYRSDSDMNVGRENALGSGNDL